MPNLNSSVIDYAPGNILQNYYLKKRLKLTNDQLKAFCEIGSGNGRISRILLEQGLSGYAFELSEVACKRSKELNKDFVGLGAYNVFNENFFTSKKLQQVDIVIASHVIEHLSDADLFLFFEKAKTMLTPHGRIVVLVPAGMKYWGPEDETAGHYRRFEFSDFDLIANKYGLEIVT